MAYNKLDLACGEFTKVGFIGIDNSDINVVNNHKIFPDVKHDLNKGIPFPDNSCDEIYASHSLEHFKNPYFILDEIWRVCIDGARVEIIVPLLDWRYDCHITCFYDGWFERILDQSRWSVVRKEINDKMIHDEGRLAVNLTEMRVILKVKK